MLLDKLKLLVGEFHDLIEVVFRAIKGYKEKRDFLLMQACVKRAKLTRSCYGISLEINCAVLIAL